VRNIWEGGLPWKEYVKAREEDIIAQFENLVKEERRRDINIGA
jgi:hypothetical protein